MLSPLFHLNRKNLVLLTVLVITTALAWNATSPQPVQAQKNDKQDAKAQKSTKKQKKKVKTQKTSAERAKPSKKSCPEYLPQPSSAEQKIIDALDQQVTAEFPDIPLCDAMEFLSELTQVPIYIDEKALEEEGVLPDEPINLNISGIRFESALHLILEPLGLTYLVKDDVLKITTEIREEEISFTRIYPVGDLCQEPDDCEQLLQAIQSTVESSIWEEVDGAGGTIAYLKTADSLVIKQTFQTHRKILDFLRNLREAKQYAQSQYK